MKTSNHSLPADRPLQVGAQLASDTAFQTQRRYETIGFKKVWLTTAISLSASLCAFAQVPESPSPNLSNHASVTDTEWRALMAGENPSTPGVPSSATDWAAISARSRNFLTRFPDHPGRLQIRKLELEAGFRAGAMMAADQELHKRLAVYLADDSVPASHRFDIRRMQLQAELQAESASAPAQNKAASNVRRAKFYRTLVAEFPEDRRGHGLLLALAKGDAARLGHELAEEILASAHAPDEFRIEAMRVLGRIGMQGRSLYLSTPGIDLAALRGRAVLIYTWSVKWPFMLQTIERLQKNNPDIQFVGINVDEEREAAKTAFAAANITGIHVYDGGGLHGPIAEQLQLTMVSSLLLVDPNGIVIDVNAHEQADAKIRHFTAFGKSLSPRITDVD
jgi:hypothetical protein